MAVFALEDLQTSVEVMVFPKSMTDHGHKLVDDAIVTVRARVDGREDQPKLIAMEIEPFEPMSGEAFPLRVKVAAAALSEGLIDDLKRLLGEHPGDSPVLLHLGERRCCGCPRRGPSTSPPASSPSSACCSGPPRSWPERNLDPRVTVLEQVVRGLSSGSRVAPERRIYWTRGVRTTSDPGAGSECRSRSRPRTARRWGTPSSPSSRICARKGPCPTRSGVLSKQAEAWVLVTQARENDKLKGFSFSTLERIGGTPSVLIGLASIKRGSKRDTVLRAIIQDELRRAVLAFPDEDVLIGTRFTTAAGFEAFKALNDVVPRPDHKASGEERAWGRRLAKRFGGRHRRLRRPLVRGQGQRQPARGARPREPEARGASRPTWPPSSRASTPSGATRSWPSAGPWPKTSPSSRSRRSLGRSLRPSAGGGWCEPSPPTPVDPAVVDGLVDLARRAPSAGNSQGVAYVVLEGAEQTARYWDVALPAERARRRSAGPAWSTRRC